MSGVTLVQVPYHLGRKGVVSRFAVDFLTTRSNGEADWKIYALEINLRMGGTTAARFTFEPGWKWSESIKPVAGTDTCQVRHVGILQSGTLHVTHEDGSESDIGPGDAYVIEPGHDAWVVGDEPFVGFEFESKSAEEYAQS